MKKTIAVLPGDGVGPEIINEAIKVLEKISELFSHEFFFRYGLIGHAGIEKKNNPLPEETKNICREADAILFGAIGDPRYDNDPSLKIRPEQGLLELRKLLGLYANVRPIHSYDVLLDTSPIKNDVIKDTDFIVIRELIGGIYFGEPRGRNEHNTRAFDTCVYTKEEIVRVAEFSFKLAETRKRKLTVVDKANVLETSRLWRETIRDMSHDYPNIKVDFMFIDNASMQIIKHPKDFDVILTENMFGDILTDEASVITGSIGMLPSASIGRGVSLYEPIHGSFPKAAGKNIANPIGTILSVAMMFEYSFGLLEEKLTIMNAVNKTLAEGYGTKDISINSVLTTSQMGDMIIRNMTK